MSTPDTATPIPPALTPEAWSEALHEGGTGLGNASVALIGDTLSIDGNGDAPLVRLRGPDRTALAALALHGQPFGPKREWVVALTRFADDVCGTVADCDDCKGECGADVLALREAAAFIAALLPPEGTAT